MAATLREKPVAPTRAPLRQRAANRTKKPRRRCCRPQMRVRDLRWSDSRAAAVLAGADGCARVGGAWTAGATRMGRVSSDATPWTMRASDVDELQGLVRVCMHSLGAKQLARARERSSSSSLGARRWRRGWQRPLAQHSRAALAVQQQSELAPYTAHLPGHGAPPARLRPAEGRPGLVLIAELARLTSSALGQRAQPGSQHPAPPSPPPPALATAAAAVDQPHEDPPKPAKGKRGRKRIAEPLDNIKGASYSLCLALAVVSLAPSLTSCDILLSLPQTILPSTPRPSASSRTAPRRGPSASARRSTRPTSRSASRSRRPSSTPSRRSCAGASPLSPRLLQHANVELTWPVETGFLPRTRRSARAPTRRAPTSRSTSSRRQHPSRTRPRRTPAMRPTVLTPPTRRRPRTSSRPSAAPRPRRRPTQSPPHPTSRPSRPPSLLQHSRRRPSLSHRLTNPQPFLHPLSSTTRSCRPSTTSTSTSRRRSTSPTRSRSLSSSHP